MRHAQTRWTRLLALSALLGTGACAGHDGEEPLYVLRDSMGRSVAMAGASQIGGAAPGTVLRANLGGVEQSVMVGERVGLGPAMGPRPAAAAPVAVAAVAPAAALPPIAEIPIMGGVTAAPLDPLAASSGTEASPTRSAQGAGQNPSSRRRGPPPASVSRSVM
ncbi:hypothetical protein [Sediminicoccus sp. BL-A-41-H5]|uniref:hypothetical protein n=1 Tax=Sediminicoccus sp. BL-A-41-H5 TaxID=3421106 RepID=UPI003D67D0C8